MEEPEGPVTKRPRLGEDSGEPPAGEDASDGLEALGGEQLEEAEQDVLDEVAGLQQQLEQIDGEVADRVLQVEQEFWGRRQPVYQQRSAALSRIPGFWKKVLFIHPTIRNIVSEADLDVLDYLEEVFVEDHEDIKSGFSVKFTFADGNPYFSNRELVKDLVIDDDDDAGLTVTATDVQWLPGREPTTDPSSADFKPETDYCLFASWFQSAPKSAVVPDEFATALKEDIWPDPVQWWSEAEQAMGGGLFGEGEEEGLGEEGEYEADEGEDEGAGGPGGVVFVDDNGQEVEVVEVYDEDEEAAAGEGAADEAGPDEGDEGHGEEEGA